VEEQHSRVPVYDPAKGQGNIIVCFTPRTLRGCTRAWSPWSILVAEAIKIKSPPHHAGSAFVPETKTASDLLLDFQKRKRHLASWWMSSAPSAV